MRRFRAQELLDYLQRTVTNPLLLDVREPWEYDYCRIEGSELVPMGQISTAHGELDREREIVVICHHGIRSYRVAHFLEHVGFERVINLEGGIDAWAREVDPDIKLY